MGEMADFFIEQEMRADALGYYDERRSPIWTDITSKEYWRWKNIEDSHLLNIIKLLDRRGAPAELIAKFRRQAKKRGLIEGVG